MVDIIILSIFSKIPIGAVYRPYTEDKNAVGVLNFIEAAGSSLFEQGCSLMELDCNVPYNGTNVSIDGPSINMLTNVPEGYEEKICLRCIDLDDSETS